MAALLALLRTEFPSFRETFGASVTKSAALQTDTVSAAALRRVGDETDDVHSLNDSEQLVEHASAVDYATSERFMQ
ncbi:hypothetical protein PFICI_03769 [Pestalotiopsis fici W106-1]|uniref:Uncharacterized protein n=1 Tax=Pestalotiopsis fici (strain W106-1 / CGMCC3.15140) TaxID=1229662 RepID=W3XID0_PESFW|nr:uncharacterized protein PFICI_03769 [Pestalotiopsis fici W106-1]ETS85744.1 hypothetical protein PFICI_03769 [Pestalotiopsis fici W106-1]